MNTNNGMSIPDSLVGRYLDSLVGQFFKILPMAEEHEPTLVDYMRSLQSELIGFSEVIASFGDDPSYLSLISILQYLYDGEPDIHQVKREVFKAIRICKKLREKYFPEEV